MKREPARTLAVRHYNTGTESSGAVCSRILDSLAECGTQDKRVEFSNQLDEAGYHQRHIQISKQAVGRKFGVPGVVMERRLCDSVVVLFRRWIAVAKCGEKGEFRRATSGY